MVLGRKQGLPAAIPRGIGPSKDVLEALRPEDGPVVVLIDGYDRSRSWTRSETLEAAEAMREALRGFYTVLKDYDSYTPFRDADWHHRRASSPAMNNLDDISVVGVQGDIVEFYRRSSRRIFRVDWRRLEKMKARRAKRCWSE